MGYKQHTINVIQTASPGNEIHIKLLSLFNYLHEWFGLTVILVNRSIYKSLRFALVDVPPLQTICSDKPKQNL